MSGEIEGTIPCELIGGPLDGAKYGDLPDLAGPLTHMTLSVPLGQPAGAHAAAIYMCLGEAPVAGLWQFFYERTEHPDANVEAAAPTQGPMNGMN